MNLLTVTDYLQNSLEVLNDYEYKCQYDLPTKFYSRAGGWLLDLNLNHFKKGDKIKEVIFTDYARHNVKVKKKVYSDKEGIYFMNNDFKCYINDFNFPYEF